MDCVSVIIPTFNRFKFLLNAVQSIKLQTYNNIEIIVVNDCSSEKEYYEYNWKENGVNIIHIKKNSKMVFGFGCPAWVRNKGLEKTNGKYIAFCDDDDIWFPSKIELQLNAMKNTGCKMSSTNGLFGNGVYDSNKLKLYTKFHSHDNEYPKIWNKNFILKENCIICSSVLIEKEILDKINNMKCIKYAEDYDCWLRALEHTNSVYLKDICIYYDANHGYGIHYTSCSKCVEDIIKRNK